LASEGRDDTAILAASSQSSVGGECDGFTFGMIDNGSGVKAPKTLTTGRNTSWLRFKDTPLIASVSNTHESQSPAYSATIWMRGGDDQDESR
jgi:hypothetical protein